METQILITKTRMNIIVGGYLEIYFVKSIVCSPISLFLPRMFEPMDHKLRAVFGSNDEMIKHQD